MNCTCNIEYRRLTPGVFNLKQHLNDAETMVWKLTSRLTNNGELDLCDYDAFLVLSVNGVIDEIMLTKTMIDDNGDGEADALCGASRYQRSPERQDTRAGSLFPQIDDARWRSRFDDSEASNLAV